MDDYLKSWFDSMNDLAFITESQRALSESILDAISGHRIQLDQTTGSQLAAELANADYNRLWESAGLHFSMAEMLEAMTPNTPAAFVDLVGVDLASNLATLAAFDQRAEFATVASVLGGQIAEIGSSYDSFLHNLIELSPAAIELTMAHRIASEAIQISGAVFAGISQLEEFASGLPETPVVTSTLFPAILRESRAFEADEPDPPFHVAEARLESRNSSQLVSLAAEIIESRRQINEITEVSGGEPTFKATNKSEYAVGMLTLSVVSSREEFFAFSERMYFMVYESSANFSRLRKIDSNYPRVIDRIKHFRLYEAHDTQHGPNREIERKATQVGDHFKELIGKRYPQYEEDWTQAQIALMKELAEYLQTIQKRL